MRLFKAESKQVNHKEGFAWRLRVMCLSVGINVNQLIINEEHDEIGVGNCVSNANSEEGPIQHSMNEGTIKMED